MRLGVAALGYTGCAEFGVQGTVPCIGSMLLS